MAMPDELVQRRVARGFKPCLAFKNNVFLSGITKQTQPGLHLQIRKEKEKKETSYNHLFTPRSVFKGGCTRILRGHSRNTLLFVIVRMRVALYLRCYGHT
jgi:hypothetical protein